MPAPMAAAISKAAETCPRRIQNHCQPVGLLPVGEISCCLSVLPCARVSSSVSKITCLARLSQVAVSTRVSPCWRVTLSCDCPSRLL